MMKNRWTLALLAAALLGTSAMAPASTGRRERGPQTSARPGWPRPQVMKAAMRAYQCARAAGHFREPTLTIIDYSLPSTRRRLWVIDLESDRILFHEHVAHGRNSGANRARVFSDQPGSKMSSLGLFRTAETYHGRHGFALRLDGLEPGFNQTARDRAIVLHGADYASPRSIARLGRLGRSWGCPAVRREISEALIDRIRGGTALFVYYPDEAWLSASPYLNCADGEENPAFRGSEARATESSRSLP